MVTEKQKANLRPCTKENARERQLKSAAKRKENRTMREIMMELVSVNGTKEAIINSVILKARNGDLAAFDRVRDVLKEQGDTSTLQSLTLSVSAETADVLNSITNGEQNK